MSYSGSVMLAKLIPWFRLGNSAYVNTAYLNFSLQMPLPPALLARLAKRGIVKHSDHGKMFIYMILTNTCPLFTHCCVTGCLSLSFN